MCRLFLLGEGNVNINIYRCEEFQRQGCKVYATSRRIETIADFKTGGIEKLALDVNSDESVAAVLAHIMEKEGKIDVVVNNAGLIVPGKTHLTRTSLVTFTCITQQAP